MQEVSSVSISRDGLLGLSAYSLATSNAIVHASVHATLDKLSQNIIKSLPAPLGSSSAVSGCESDGSQITKREFKNGMQIIRIPQESDNIKRVLREIRGKMNAKFSL